MEILQLVCRPSFENLIDLLKKALVDIMLPTSICPDAGKFWSRHWAGQSKVPFKSFCDAFNRDVLPKKLSPEQTECFKKLLTESSSKEEVLVDIERFSHVLKWFGPLRVDTQLTLADRVEAVMREPWYFGDLGTIEAQDKVELYKEEPGTFLVRLNLGGGAKMEEAPFTITSSTSKGSFHTRCYIRDKSGFIVQLKRGDAKVKIATKSPFIEDLIRELKSKEPMVCGKPVAGSPYAYIFRSSVILSRYDFVDDDTKS